jgi:hypothetical protein
LDQCHISSDDLRIKSSASETLVLPEHTTEQEVILSREMRIFKNAPECLVWMREPNITSLDVGILQLITQSSPSLLEEPGLLFSSAEFEMAKGTMRVAAAFEWSAVCCSNFVDGFVSLTDVYLSVRANSMDRSGRSE